MSGWWPPIWPTDPARLETTTRADNWGMRAVLARCGCAKEARYRQVWTGPDGAHDAVGYAIFRAG